MTDIAIILGVVAIIAVAARLLRRREGTIRAADGPVVDLASLGVPGGTAAFVEFTAPGCVPCARTAQVLDRVTEGRSDVTVVAVDVGEHLDLARAHAIMRAPTTLLVDAGGTVRHRIAGVPEEDPLRGLLDGEGGDREAAA